MSIRFNTPQEFLAWLGLGQREKKVEKMTIEEFFNKAPDIDLRSRIAYETRHQTPFQSPVEEINFYLDERLVKRIFRAQMVYNLMMPISYRAKIFAIEIDGQLVLAEGCNSRLGETYFDRTQDPSIKAFLNDPETTFFRSITPTLVSR